MFKDESFDLENVVEDSFTESVKQSDMSIVNVIYRFKAHCAVELRFYQAILITQFPDRDESYCGG